VNIVLRLDMVKRRNRYSADLGLRLNELNFQKRHAVQVKTWHMQAQDSSMILKSDDKHPMLDVKAFALLNQTSGGIGFNRRMRHNN